MINNTHSYRPQTKFAKVMFLHVSVCPRGGGIPACLAGGIPAWLAGLRERGVVSRPTSAGGGKLRRLARGVSRPIRGGCIPACTEADFPVDGYCHRRYASYWNAFLFEETFQRLLLLLYISKTDQD